MTASAFKVGRAFDQCGCLEAVVVSVFTFGRFIDEMHMLSVADCDRSAGSAAAFMGMSVGRIGIEAKFVHMAVANADRFTRYAAEAVIMTALTFCHDLRRSGKLVNMVPVRGVVCASRFCRVIAVAVPIIHKKLLSCRFTLKYVEKYRM